MFCVVLTFDLIVEIDIVNFAQELSYNLYRITPFVCQRTSANGRQMALPKAVEKKSLIS